MRNVEIFNIFFYSNKFLYEIVIIASFAVNSYRVTLFFRYIATNSSSNSDNMLRFNAIAKYCHKQNRASNINREKSPVGIVRLSLQNRPIRLRIETIKYQAQKFDYKFRRSPKSHADKLHYPEISPISHKFSGIQQNIFILEQVPKQILTIFHPVLMKYRNFLILTN